MENSSVQTRRRKRTARVLNLGEKKRKNHKNKSYNLFNDDGGDSDEEKKNFSSQRQGQRKKERKEKKKNTKTKRKKRKLYVPGIDCSHPLITWLSPTVNSKG